MAIMFFALPGIVAGKFEKKLIQAGVYEQSIASPEKKWGAIRYTNLTIGQDSENAIDTITLHFTAANLFSTTLESLEINGLYISGDVDINGNLSIKGLETSPNLKTLASLKARQIHIKNANFSILSAHFGGLRGVVNIYGQREDDAMVWTGNIDSRQEQLELIAKLNAQTNDSGRWIADIEIENAKLERSFGKFTRVSGASQYAGMDDTWQTLNTELNAGGFTAYDTSWQNAAITINATRDNTETYISAKSSGIEGIELNIDADLTLNKIDWNARIYSPTGQKLIQYLSSHNMMPLEKRTADAVADKKGVTVQLKPNKNSLIFRINNQQEELDIKGKIEKTKSRNFRSVFLSNNGIEDANCIKRGAEKYLCHIEFYNENGQYSLNN